MKKITFVVLFMVLFSGCGSIQGVSTTMKVDGSEQTFSIGNGWQYVFNIGITNSSPGTIAHVLAIRGNDMKDVAQLRPGETHMERLTSSMCYGNNGKNYSYLWNNKPPEVIYKVNLYKEVGDSGKKGTGNAQFLTTLTHRFNMFDCADPINKFASWDIGGYWGSGGFVLR